MRDRGVERGDEGCARLVEASVLQRGGVLVDPQVAVDNRGAGDLADDPGELGEVESWAAELVGPVPVVVLE